MDSNLTIDELNATPQQSDKKPCKAKPYFYACCLAALQQIAKDFGYNLLIHGSMNRDMDLVAVPWVDNPKPHNDLLNSFCDYLGVPQTVLSTGESDYMHTVLPGGRDNYIIQLNRGGRYNNYFDEQYYLDISFTHLINK